MKEKIFKKLSSLLKEKDSSENWSSTRLAFLLSVFISNFLIFGLWLGLSIKSNSILAIPESVLVLYAVANGLSFGGKQIQKMFERAKIGTKVEKKD